jgi:hypothetical protein
LKAEFRRQFVFDLPHIGIVGALDNDSSHEFVAAMEAATR